MSILSHKQGYVSSTLTPATSCPHGDPLCPCPDGDSCHHKDVILPDGKISKGWFDMEGKMR